MKITRTKILSSESNSKYQMTIHVSSGINSDGFSIDVTDSEGKPVFSQKYSYGYDASYDKSFADKNKPFVADIIDEVCKKYNIDKNTVKVTTGKNVFKNGDIDTSRVDNFIKKYVESSKKIMSAEEDNDPGFNEWLYQKYGIYSDDLTDDDYDMYEDMYLVAMGRSPIHGAEEDASEDDLEQVDQPFTSKDTSINSSKLPVIYKLVNFPKGSVVLDYGGGKFDNGIEYLESIGCKGYVYDPYNRDTAYNRSTVRAIRENGGADIVLNSNVLNVIQEEEARINVLKNIRKMCKPSGKVYITVYEGKGTGEGKQSKEDSYQLNRKTADYLEEIQRVFPDAVRKGKLIIATPTGDVTASENIVCTAEGLEDVKDMFEDGYQGDGWFADEIKLDAGDGNRLKKYLEDLGYKVKQNLREKLWVLPGECFWSDTIFYPYRPDPRMSSVASSQKITAARAPYKIQEGLKTLQDKLYNAASKLMQSPEYGFPLEDIAEYLVIEVETLQDGNDIVGYKAEVRAELSFDGMLGLAEALNPIVEKIDPDAYFDQVTGGIMDAYMYFPEYKKRIGIYESEDVDSCYNDVESCDSSDIQESDSSRDTHDHVVFGSQDFISWYDSLSEKEQAYVDDIADEEDIPFYEEATDEQLSFLQDLYESRKNQRRMRRPIQSSSISDFDIQKTMLRAADIQDHESLIRLLGDLLSIDKKMYQHYCDLDQSGEYSPAAIGKMISDDLYWKLEDDEDIVESATEVSSELEKDVYIFLDEQGEYSDYDQKVLDVIETFEVDQETAEDLVRTWSSGKISSASDIAPGKYTKYAPGQVIKDYYEDKINLPGYAVEWVGGYNGWGVNRVESQYFRTPEERDAFADELKAKGAYSLKKYEIPNFYHTLPEVESATDVNSDGWKRYYSSELEREEYTIYTEEGKGFIYSFDGSDDRWGYHAVVTPKKGRKYSKSFYLQDSLEKAKKYVEDHLKSSSNDVEGSCDSKDKDKVESASYGGAYDIEDDMYFTKEEIVEFAEEVAEKFSEWSGSTFDVESVYINDPNHLEVTLTDGDYSLEASSFIDMRRIKKPSDINKYQGLIMDQLKHAYKEYYDSDAEFDVHASSDILAVTDADYEEFLDLEDPIYQALQAAGGDLDDFQGDIRHSSYLSDHLVLSFETMSDEKIKAAKFKKDVEKNIIETLKKTRFNDNIDVDVYPKFNSRDNVDFPQEMRSHWFVVSVSAWAGSDVESSQEITAAEEYIDWDNPIDAQKVYEVEFDCQVVVEPDGTYYIPEEYNFEEIYDDEYEFTVEDDSDFIAEHLQDMIEYQIPEEPGTYRISGVANMAFDIQNIYGVSTPPEPDEAMPGYYYNTDEVDVTFDLKSSTLEDFQCEKV